MELQAAKSEFDEQGIGIVAATYDSVADQERFLKKYSVDYAMVSDAGGASARILGIFNDTYAEDHFAYGVPYPGFYILDANGVIVAKSFLDGYDIRLNAETMLKMANEALN